MSKWMNLGRLGLAAAMAWLAMASLPAEATEVYVNGLKATGARAAELLNCTVKFDTDGNLHILSPGYNIVVDDKGLPKVTGTSDLVGLPPTGNMGTTKNRYVLVYQPNLKVAVQFDVYVNQKLFRRIGLADGAFTVDLTQDLKPGLNDIRVVGKPEKGPGGGTEVDVAMVKVLSGRENADGRFVAKSPAVWEFVRSAVDAQPLDRTGRFVAE